MSVFKRTGAETYSFDFYVRGRRFSGNTETRNRKEAEAVERKLKAKAKEDIEAEKRTGNGPLFLRHATGRYWQETGKNHKDSAATYRDLARLIEFSDPTNGLTRSATPTCRRSSRGVEPRPSRAGRDRQARRPFDRQRSTTEVLRKVITRARKAWRCPFTRAKLAQHRLKEPEGRVRELHGKEDSARRGNARRLRALGRVRAVDRPPPRRDTDQMGERQLGGRQDRNDGQGRAQSHHSHHSGRRRPLRTAQGHTTKTCSPIRRSARTGKWSRAAAIQSPMRAAKPNGNASSSARAQGLQVPRPQTHNGDAPVKGDWKLAPVQQALNHADINHGSGYAHVADPKSPRRCNGSRKVPRKVPRARIKHRKPSDNVEYIRCEATSFLNLGSGVRFLSGTPFSTQFPIHRHARERTPVQPGDAEAGPEEGGTKQRWVAVTRWLPLSAGDQRARQRTPA